MSRDSALGRRLEALVTATRFGKFVSVGAVGAACDTAVFVALAEVVGLVPELALLSGIEVAIVVMFLVNDRWTFATEGGANRRSVLSRLGKSHAVRAGGSLAQVLVFVVVYRLLFVEVTVLELDAWLLVAKGAGIVSGLLINYVFETLFTWQAHLG